MSNALISNETVPAGTGWRYTAGAFNVAGSISGQEENGAGRSLMTVRGSFGFEPYKFTVKETDKELRLKRLMAFGRGLTGQGWS